MLNPAPTRSCATPSTWRPHPRDVGQPRLGGQSFIESQVDKIKTIRAMCDEAGVDPWIEVDGGVGPANAYKVIDAGANHRGWLGCLQR